MEETTNKRDHWPTGLFDCCSGGTSLCLWGFLCPLCLEHQGWNYSSYLRGYSSSSSSSSSSKNAVIESQFEQYPPWSCRGTDCPNLPGALILSCLCIYCIAFAKDRHSKYSPRLNFEFYCSSQPCCCCCEGLPIEDCLIGYFCCCCSVIQVTMARDEHFRMKSKVEGDVNIKRAL